MWEGASTGFAKLSVETRFCLWVIKFVGKFACFMGIAPHCNQVYSLHIYATMEGEFEGGFKNLFIATLCLHPSGSTLGESSIEPWVVPRIFFTISELLSNFFFAKFCDFSCCVSVFFKVKQLIEAKTSLVTMPVAKSHC